MRKYVTYFEPLEECYYIELTDVKDSKWGKEIYKGIINKEQIFETLEDARNSLKKTSRIIKEKI